MLLNGDYSIAGSLTVTGIVASRTRRTKSITIEFPSATENVAWFYTATALTIESAVAAVTGSSTPSVTVLIQSGSSRSSLTTTNISATAVTSTSTGTTLTIANAAIAAGSWVAITTSAQSGTVLDIGITITVYDT